MAFTQAAKRCLQPKGVKDMSKYNCLILPVESSACLLHVQGGLQRFSASLAAIGSALTTHRCFGSEHTKLQKKGLSCMCSCLDLEQTAMCCKQIGFLDAGPMTARGVPISNLKLNCFRPVPGQAAQLQS